MPEMWFDIVWPDGQRERCYSPSLVIKDNFSAGSVYRLDDFMARGRVALTEASERVRQKYGFPCSRALAQLAKLECGYQRYADRPDAEMRVEEFLERNG